MVGLGFIILLLLIFTIVGSLFAWMVRLASVREKEEVSQPSKTDPNYHLKAHCSVNKTAA